MAGLRAIFSLAGPDLPTNEVVVDVDTFAIGRMPTNNLPLNHQKVSRHHADITLKGAYFIIEDLESSNGTYVNEARIEPKKPVPLQPGDVIRIGPFTLTLLRVDQEAPAVQAAPPPPPPARKEEPPAPAVVPQTEPPPAPGEAPTVKPQRTAAQAPTPEPKVAEAVAPAPPAKKDGKRDGRGAPARDEGVEIEIVHPARPPSTNGYKLPLEPYVPIEGVPLTESRYLQYLPGMYSDSDFLKRYLLIMESILAPLEWGIDSGEQFYNPLVTTPDWLRWIGGWFDILIHPAVPIERQRAVVKELGVLFMQRGTRKGLTRLLELYFGVKPAIVEMDTPPSSFKVRMKLGAEDTPLMRALAQQLIEVCKPAHTGFTMEFD